jgi:hypothetical protein
VCLLEVAGEGVLCLGVRGGEAEPALLVVVEVAEAQRRLDRAPPVPPEAAGRVEAVVPQQLPALVGDQGEFGDDPDRYQTTKGRKAFAGTAPVTRASGCARWWWPGRPVISGWWMPVICGRSRR